MIEIKVSKKLHASGFRMMEVSNDGKVLSSCADVIHLGSKILDSDIRIDVHKNGTIRIFSSTHDLITPYDGCSDVFVEVRKKSKSV